MFSPNPDHPDTIDLRSDTITHPTEAMRMAMHDAPLGDDVLGDEPTVLQLESAAAEKLGVEATMFVPSGTMGNLTAGLALTGPGDAVICETGAHLYRYEAGALSGVGGVVFRPVPGERGFLTPKQVTDNVQSGNYHLPWTKLLCLENTHNNAGGTCLSLQQFEDLCDAARNADLKIHLDGARLWNASVATGIPLQAFTSRVDTVSCCFSKGLSAPVGSIVGGSAETIHQARRKRKMLGGAMRQAGVLAAAALLAMQTMVDRLADDHRRARALAEHVNALPGYRIDLANVETNIIMIDISGLGRPSPEVVKELESRRVRSLTIDPAVIRLVTNRHFTDEKLARACEAFSAVKP